MCLQANYISLTAIQQRLGLPTQNHFGYFMEFSQKEMLVLSYLVKKELKDYEKNYPVFLENFSIDVDEYNDLLISISSEIDYSKTISKQL